MLSWLVIMSVSSVSIILITSNFNNWEFELLILKREQWGDVIYNGAADATSMEAANAVAKMDTKL